MRCFQEVHGLFQETNLASRCQGNGRQLTRKRGPRISNPMDQGLNRCATATLSRERTPRPRDGPSQFLLGSHVGAFAANRPQLGPWQCNRVDPALGLAYLSFESREQHEWTRRADCNAWQVPLHGWFRSTQGPGQRRRSGGGYATPGKGGEVTCSIPIFYSGPLSSHTALLAQLHTFCTKHSGKSVFTMLGSAAGCRRWRHALESACSHPLQRWRKVEPQQCRRAWGDGQSPTPSRGRGFPRLLLAVVV